MSRLLGAMVGVGLAAILCGSAAAQTSATAAVRVTITEPTSIALDSPLGLSAARAGKGAGDLAARGAASFRLGASQDRVVSMEVSETITLTQAAGGATSGRARLTTNAEPRYGVPPAVINVAAEAQMAPHAAPGMHTGAFRMMAHLN